MADMRGRFDADSYKTEVIGRASMWKSTVDNATLERVFFAKNRTDKRHPRIKAKVEVRARYQVKRKAEEAGDNYKS